MDVHAGLIGSERGDVVGVARLDAEVELLAQPVRELGGELGHVIRDRPRGPRLERGRQLQQYLEVALDRLGDTGSLDLDDDLVARVQASAVHLADGRRGQGRPVELRERRPRGPTELRLEQLPHRVGIGERDAVLQMGQLVGDRRRQEIGSRGEHLPELDEDAAAVLEGPAHAEGHRRATVGRRRNVVLRHTQRATEPVLGCDARHLHVAADASRSAAQAADRARDRGQAPLGGGPGPRAWPASPSRRWPTS